MKRFTKTLSIILVFALLISALSLTGCKLKKASSKDQVLENAINKTLTAINPYPSTFDSSIDNAKASLLFDAQKLSITSNGEEMALPEAIKSLLLEISATSDGKALMEEILLKSGDESVLNIGLYIKDNKVALLCEQLLGAAVYGVDLSTFAENLPESTIGTMFGVTEEDVKELENTLSQIPNSEYQNLAEELEKILDSAIEKNYTSTTKKEDVKIFDTTVSAQVIRLEITSKNLADMLKDIVEGVKSSKTVMGFINDMSSAFAGLEDTLTGVVPESEGTDASTNDIFDGVEEVYAEIEKSGVFAKASFAINNGYLIYADARLGQEKSSTDTTTSAPATTTSPSLEGVIGGLFGDDYTEKSEEALDFFVSLTFGEDPSKTSKIVADISINGQNVSVSWVIDENTANTYKGKLTIAFEMSGAEISFTPLSLTLDKTNGKFNVSANLKEMAGFSLSLEGSLNTTKDSLAFTLDKIDYSMANDFMGETSFSITLGLEFKIEKASGSIKLPEYKDILTLTEEELMEIMASVEEFAQSLSELLPFFGTAAPDDYPSDEEFYY